MTRSDLDDKSGMGDDLRSEWTRLSEGTRPPGLDDLRRRSSERSARRNSTIAGVGAATLAVAALGVTLGGIGLGRGGGSATEGSQVAAGSAFDAATGSASTQSEYRAAAPNAPFGLDEARPGMTSSADGSLLERLQEAESRVDAPLPQSMPQTARPLADVTAVDRFTELADQIYVFSGENMNLNSSRPGPLVIQDVRESLKDTRGTPSGGPISLTIDGSQAPTGSATGLYLAFAKQGRSLAVYAVNGAYAQQVSPVRTSAPGQIRVDTLRTALALRAGKPLPAGTAGRAMPMNLYTHCGIAGFHLGGRWYAREGGELNDGNGNPPAGWGYAQQAGQLTLTEDASRATFTDDAGHRETFRPGDPTSPEATRLCS